MSGSNSSLIDTGSNSTVNLGTGSFLNVYGSNNNVTLNGSDVLGAYGGNNAITTLHNQVNGSNDIYLSNTNGSPDTVTANNNISGGTTGNGPNTTGVYTANGVQVNLHGSNDAINIAGSDVLGAFGGGNTINETNTNPSASSDIYISGTNASFDRINASDVQGGLSLPNSGNLSGIFLDSNAQANLYGNTDTVNLGTGDSLGTYAAAGSSNGGGDTIGTQQNDLVYLTSTNGNRDIVNGSNDAGGSLTANGQGTGISMAANTQALITGNSNTVNGGGGDSITISGNNDGVNVSYATSVDFSGQNLAGSVLGSGDTIHGQAGDSIGVTGTNDGVIMSDGTLYEGAGTQTSLAGSNDTVGASNGDTLGLSSGIHDLIYLSGGEMTSNAGTAFTVDGSNDGIGSSVGSAIDVNGNGDTVDGTNTQGTIVAFSGSNDGAALVDSSIVEDPNSILSVAGSNNNVYATSGDILGISGSDITGNVVAGDVVALDGYRDGVNGDSATINLEPGTQSTVYGNYDYIYADAGSTADVGGEYDNTYGPANASLGQATVNYYGIDLGDAVYGNLNAPLVDNEQFYPDGSDNPYANFSGNGYATSFNDGIATYETIDLANPDDGYDPVVLNLQGNAVQTTNILTQPVYYAVRPGGAAVQTGWVTPGEGLLVWDPSGSRTIDSSNLVPDFSWLQGLDSNGDGVLNSSDPGWQNLRVWVDSTGNAQFTPNALKTLGQLGIASIGLGGANTAKSVDNGNIVTAQSSFTTSSGATGQWASVNFAFNPGLTEISHGLIGYTPGSGTLDVLASSPIHKVQVQSTQNLANDSFGQDTSGNVLVTDGILGDTISIGGLLNGTNTQFQRLEFLDGESITTSQLVFAAQHGSAGADTITGTSGNDVLDGRGGQDVEIGGGGNDTYLFRPGDGHLTIENGTATGTAATGQLDLGTGLTQNALWFSQNGNDLDIQVLGTPDAVVVQDWFSGNVSAQLSAIVAGNGMKLESGVTQLVQAMAAYQTGHTSFSPGAATHMPSDPTLQAAVAAAWR